MQERFPEHDTAITAWFAKNGWTVTAKHYDFDREIYAWRDEVRLPKVTLRVSEEVLDDVPVLVLIQAFESFGLAKVLETNPTKYVLVCLRAPGTPGVNVLAGPP